MFKIYEVCYLQIVLQLIAQFIRAVVVGNFHVVTVATLPRLAMLCIRPLPQVTVCTT